jgi:hypothetical protein
MIEGLRQLGRRLAAATVVLLLFLPAMTVFVVGVFIALAISILIKGDEGVRGVKKFIDKLTKQ